MEQTCKEKNTDFDVIWTWAQVQFWLLFSSFLQCVVLGSFLKYHIYYVLKEDNDILYTLMLWLLKLYL